MFMIYGEIVIFDSGTQGKENIFHLLFPRVFKLSKCYISVDLTIIFSPEDFQKDYKNKNSLQCFRFLMNPE